MGIDYSYSKLETAVVAVAGVLAVVAGVVAVVAVVAAAVAVVDGIADLVAGKSCTVVECVVIGIVVVIDMTVGAGDGYFGIVVVVGC